MPIILEGTVYLHTLILSLQDGEFGHVFESLYGNQSGSLWAWFKAKYWESRFVLSPYMEMISVESVACGCAHIWNLEITVGKVGVSLSSYIKLRSALWGLYF